MFSNSLKMVSPSKGYSPVVKLYRVTPLKMDFDFNSCIQLGWEIEPWPDVNLEPGELFPAICHLGRLKSRGALCWISLTLFKKQRLITWLVVMESSLANTSSCSQTCQEYSDVDRTVNGFNKIWTHPKVCNLEDACLIQEQVARFDVFVNNT